MSANYRPYIGEIAIGEWIDRKTKETTPGIKVFGVNGLAAHLTADEAFNAANTLVDLAEQLTATTAPPKAKRQRIRTRTRRSSATLTDASGAPEEPLETTPAESE